MRSMRLQRFLKAQKSLLKTSESSRFLNSAYFDVLRNKVFWQNHEISGLILITFLLEAVEASLCYFFKNWLMKHKSPNLLKPLGTIIHQNSQFYYPSEPFSFHHFNVRHPVEDFYFEFSKTKQSLDSSPKSCPFDLELSLWPAFWGKSLTKYACIHDLQTRTY